MLSMETDTLFLRRVVGRGDRLDFDWIPDLVITTATPYYRQCNGPEMTAVVEEAAMKALDLRSGRI